MISLADSTAQDRFQMVLSFEGNGNDLVICNDPLNYEVYLCYWESIYFLQDFPEFRKDKSNGRYGVLCFDFGENLICFYIYKIIDILEAPHD